VSSTIIRPVGEPSRDPNLRPAAQAQIRRGRTAAQGVIAALALPAPLSPQPTRPLPLPHLHRLPRDTSMLYDISRIDASGRVASLIIVTALGWQPQDRLELILTEGAIVLRVSPEGLFCVQQCLRIVIPAAARRRHSISPGDYVLLAAAPEYDTVIAYPPSAIDDMIARYHSVPHAQGPAPA
jgi:bifunctional DNA-binding transcriptional regulator/antitoxin component of YhaV-PrlF toxin-antitoxin module